MSKVNGQEKWEAAGGASAGQGGVRLGGVIRLWIVVGLAGVYMAGMSALSILQHYGLKTQMNDLGDADHAIWMASRCDLSMPQIRFGEKKITSYLNEHANLIYWGLALLYKLWASPELLLILQSLACAMTGLGLYGLARRRIGEGWWSLAPPLVFWLSPIAQDANLYDFHIITVATALVVWMVWMFDAGRPRAGWILFSVILLCQEDVTLVLAMYGVYLTISGQRRRGLTVIAVSLIYLAFLLNVIVPFFGAKYGVYKLVGPDDRYDWIGQGLGGILQGIFTCPEMVLQNITMPCQLRMLIYLLLSGALAGLRAWGILLLILPQLMANILTGSPWTVRITGTYYWIMAEAIIIMACLFSVSRDRQDVPCPRFSGRLTYLMSATLLFSMFFSPLPYGRWSWWSNYAIPEERGTFEEFRRMIPAEAPLCVQNNLGAYFSQRSHVRAFSGSCWDGDYALFYLKYVGGPDSGLFFRTLESMLFGTSPNELIRQLKKFVWSPHWRLVVQKDRFYLFKRVAKTAPPNPDKVALLNQIQRDGTEMQRSYENAACYRPWWAGYLTGKVSWEQLSYLFVREKETQAYSLKRSARAVFSGPFKK